MKAVCVPEFGEPEVMRVEDLPEPRPGPGELLLRVRAVGVNFADHLIRLGAYPSGEPPIVPGLEAAGEVAAVGEGVVGFEPGQRVIAWCRRAYAELVVAPAYAVCPIPSGLSFEQAAAIPVVFGTAWHGLVTLARVRAGERVLVHAAGSGVGSAAVQVAHQLGAWVIASAGQDWKLERARALGATEVVNYATQDLAVEVKRLSGGEGVDVVLEGVGKATFPGSVRSLARGGRLVIYGSPSGPRVELDTREAISRNLTFFGMSITTSPRFPETIQDFASRALPWFEQGRLQAVIDTVYPLAEAAQAHRRLMERSQFGKLVLQV